MCSEWVMKLLKQHLQLFYFFVVDFEHTFAQRVRTNMNSSYWPHLPMMFLGKAMRVLKRNTGKKWLKKCSNQNCTLLCNFFENDFYKYESGEKTDKNNQQTSYNFPTLCCTKRHRMETSQLLCSANQLTGLDDNFGV